jgi:bacterioferritin-associated ferredoxin
MIVCVCKAVSDKHIRVAVKAGASCVRDLTRQFGLGTCCGKCVADARLVVAACLEARGEHPGGSGFYIGAAGAELPA